MKIKTAGLYTVLVIGSALAWSATAFAQNQAPAAASDASASATPAQHHMADPQQQLAHLRKQLNLTPDQASKVGAILQTRQQQVQAIKDDASLKGVDRREKMRSAMQSSSDAISALLNDTQKAQYAQIKAKAEERWESHKQK